jgi:hypothetical protein
VTAVAALDMLANSLGEAGGTSAETKFLYLLIAALLTGPAVPCDTSLFFSTEPRIWVTASLNERHVFNSDATQNLDDWNRCNQRDTRTDTQCRATQLTNANYATSAASTGS